MTHRQPDFVIVGAAKSATTWLQRNLQQDSPFIFMFQQVEQSAVRNNVENFISGPSFDLVFYRNVTKS